MDQHEPFTGVYELLAVRLPDEEEKRLHERLVERAAETSKSELLFRYTNARRLRPLARQKLAAQATAETRQVQHEDGKDSGKQEGEHEDKAQASERAGEGA